jgi:hypothetical protein
MRARLEQMVATVTRYPLAKVRVPARFQPGLSERQLDDLERASDVRLGSALRAFYGATDGFTFFWRAPGDGSQELIDRYHDSVPDPTTRIDWDMTHGVMIPPLERMLSEHSFGELFITHRDEHTMLRWAGRPRTDEQAAASVRVFDRFLAEGNEDGGVGLLMFPDEDPRVVGITDSAMVDPARPWMHPGTYLDLILAMGGEYGGRYELMGSASQPPGELTFTAEQIARFGRDIFRPI